MNPISDYLICKSNHNEYEANFGGSADNANGRRQAIGVASLLGSLVATAAVFMQLFA